MAMRRETYLCLKKVSPFPPYGFPYVYVLDMKKTHQKTQHFLEIYMGSNKIGSPITVTVCEVLG